MEKGFYTNCMLKPGFRIRIIFAFHEVKNADIARAKAIFFNEMEMKNKRFERFVLKSNWLKKSSPRRGFRGGF